MISFLGLGHKTCSCDSQDSVDVSFIHLTFLEILETVIGISH